LNGLLPTTLNEKLAQDETLLQKTEEIEKKHNNNNNSNNNYPNNGSANDVESGKASPDSNLDFQLPIEQKILFEQQLVRYQRSQQFQALMASRGKNDAHHQTADEVLPNSDGSNQSETLQRTLSTVDQNTTAEDIDVELTKLPALTADDLPSYCDEFTPFSAAQLAHENDGSPRLVGEHRSSVDQQEAVPTAITTAGRKIKAICSYTALPSIDDLEASMMRYFTPETNPHCYEKVYDRAWGPTYLAYRELKAVKPQKKND
jgi:hypothetical protein